MNDLNIPAFDFDWASLYSKIQTSGVELGINIITALFIFFVGRLIARVLTRGLRKIMQKQQVDQILESFVCNLAYWALMVFVIIAAITEIGVKTTSFIAVIGAAGLAIGLALQGSLSNFAAGVLIVLFRHYKVGDFIEASGVSGSVVSVQILTTTLKTGDNKAVIIPNGNILKGTITNYSANSTRRIDMVVGVGYEDDLDKVRATIKEIIDADERVLQEPACVIAVNELADSSVNFNVRPWVNTPDYWATRWDLTEAIKKRFDKDGISIPFPQRDLHIIKEA
ncbi:MAG: mechanosensitive ion channel, partial [Woeseia sp.]|nr:mechanosensitive ion channel [Woeseia sp.]NNE62413.1 mechanosensitive ion channel [Woeseia sp.]NNL54135.1 mechanosensitive ion channel [Woeseia sp.]